MAIRIKIDVTKLDKSAFFHGKNGAIYADLVLWETPDDKYQNDYRVTQDLPRERRDAGEKGEIVGNGKVFGNTASKPQQKAPPPQRKPAVDPDLDAAEDDIPF